MQRWIDAGLIDVSTGSRVVEFEIGRERNASMRWPVLLALFFGALLLVAGVTLFVAAHWDELSPAERFSLQVLMVAAFHATAAFVSHRFPVLSTALHGVGTAALGASIFLTAQIFNLHENWATGILLWAVGATAGYWLLRDWVQAALLALLVPSWLISQWCITIEWYSGGRTALAVGLVTAALCYLSARVGDDESPVRRTLSGIGAIVVLPCAAAGLAIAMESGNRWIVNSKSPLPYDTVVTIWVVALTAPLLLAWFLRRRAAWINVVFAIWSYFLMLTAGHLTRYETSSTERFVPHRNLGVTLILYSLLAAGAVGLAAWGIYEKRSERINLGVASFAISVLFFYFDNFMGKLGRSAGLLVLGLLCLAGGYALERLRRGLMLRMKAAE